MSILAALPDTYPQVDVCIIGTGPVGLVLALECERLGLSVLALEAGGEVEDAGASGSEAEIVDPLHHAPLHVGVRKAFGGTSWAWSGACVPFDPIDFRTRSHIPNSGWPIQYEEVKPYYATAAELLNCDLPQTEIAESADGIAESSASLVHSPQLARVHRDRIDRSTNITVCLNSPVVALDLSDQGDSVQTVTVATRAGKARVHASQVVIAAGGLRSTQLLLATQRTWPSLFGGVDGPLGRYYMGHLTGWISAIRFAEEADAARFQAAPVEGRPHMLQRLAIVEPVQISESLLNTSFWPTNVAFFDPSHGSAVLSVAFMALLLPVWGRAMMPAALRRASLGPNPRRIWSHCRNILSNPFKATTAAAAALWKKFIRHEELGSFLIKANSRSNYLLWYHAEHAPHADSRVTLTEKVDDLGLPLMKVDLRFSPADVDSVVKAHRILDRDLRARGIGSLRFLADEESLPARVLEQACDGYHQIGTTRMGTDARASVVNPHCRVHGIGNLYVASSSVFPTSGQANPTLLAAALAVRLAQHIAQRLRPVDGLSARPGAEMRGVGWDAF